MARLLRWRMAEGVRVMAMKLGCTGIRHGERVKTPTSLLEVMEAVLTQCCAMKQSLDRKRLKTACIEWEVTEMAPGYAELALHWHDGLHKLIPLGEYADRHEEWKKSVDERGREQRKQHNNASINVWMLAECGDQFMGDDGEEAVPEKMAAPWDESDCYVPYCATALEALSTHWKVDEPQRMAGLNALERMKDNRAQALRTQHGADKTTAEMDKLIEADPEMAALSSYIHFIRRLIDRHRTVRDLCVSLPEADENGIRLGREKYEYRAYHGPNRSAIRQGRIAMGGWQMACLKLPGHGRRHSSLLAWAYDDRAGRPRFRSNHRYHHGLQAWAAKALGASAHRLPFR